MGQIDLFVIYWNSIGVQKNSKEGTSEKYKSERIINMIR